MRRLNEIVPGIFVSTAVAYTTTSTVISDGRAGCLVIDPAVSVAELAGLAADLADLGLRPRAGFATHPHWDHLLWSRDLGDVPRYASPLAVAVAARERAGLIDRVRESAPGHDLELFARLTALAEPAGAIGWGGPETVAVTHQAHAPGHSALFFPASGTLVAGDMCSDIEVPLLDLDAADPVADYLAGLEALAALPVRLVVPGHGSAGEAAEFRRRVAADRAYLECLGRGEEPRDPRLIADWLIAEHRRQVAFVRGSPEANLSGDS